MSVTIITKNQTLHTSNQAGVKIDELAFNNGLPLNRHCGGKGVCKRCLAIIGPGKYLVHGQEAEIPAGESLEVLACQTEVISETAVITLPERSLIDNRGQIYSAFNPDHLDIEPTEKGLGIITDIGTTTIACALVKLESGRVIETASKYNQQIRLAEDVASRISLCQAETKIAELQRLVIQETINPLIKELCEQTGTTPEAIRSLTVSGNTVMEHLFHGFSPVSIGQIPFTPQTRVFKTVPAATLNINIHPEAEVRTVPAISGYVGGDITADLFVTDIHAEKDVILLIDIGTNGEIVLSDHGKLYATATAAGPAFEGAGLSHGCRAADGAIEQIKLQENGHMQSRTIGNQPPTGICGSAIIDFIAELYRADWLFGTGRYDLDELRAYNAYHHENGIHACRLTDDLSVSEKDIAEILKAKAAIFAGVQTLLSQCGKTIGEIDKVILAGGFARYIHLPHAIEIGLLPDLPEHRYEVIGNGSLAGAYYIARKPELLTEMEGLIDLPEIIELNRCAEFQDHFIDGLLLP